MNPPNPNQIKTDDELLNDPTVQLYRRIIAQETTPPALDKAILVNFKRHFRPPFWKRWLFKLNLDGEQVFNWPLAPALAIGLLVGVVLPRIHSTTVSDLNDYSGFKGDSVETAQQDLTKTPERWLEKIATLIYDGKIQAAEQELTAFKKQYPDYQPK